MKGKIWKRIVALVLVLGMLLGDSALVFAAETTEVSNICGENATWSYADGVLTIEGTGAMTKYSSSGYTAERPWQQYASEIKEVIIGDEITSVGAYAFCGIDSIENIVLGINVNETGRYAFGNTTPKSITLPNGDFTDSFAFPAYSYSSEAHDYFITVNIREDATAVSDTFLNHADVEAFRVIKAADENATVNYASYDGVLYNADYSTLIAYPRRRELPGYTVDERTKNIGARAFYNSYYLERVILPEGLENISESAFRSCEQLKEIYLPDSVSVIPSNAFRECYQLQEIHIPDSVTTIKTGAFQYCEVLENVTIGDGVTEIADIAFNRCYGIKKLKFGRNVSSIGTGAFSPMDNAGASPVALDITSDNEAVALSDSETLSIEEMLIPVKEVTMAEDSFEGVDARKVFLYSDTALSEGSVFLGFPGTESFEVVGPSEEGAEVCYAQRDGVLFDEEYREIVSYPKSKSDIEYRIADGITDIWANAFYNADILEKLYIPNSVTYIGADAFSECDNLTIYCDADSYAAEYAEANNVPYSTQENNIEFKLLKKYSVVQGEEPIVCADQIGDYDVIVAKDDVRITGCKINRSNLLLPSEQVAAGDVLKISLSSKTGETFNYTTEVTLDENGYASAEFEVLQKGRCKVSPIGADVSSVILFDMEGNRLESATCTTDSYVSGFYDTGAYQVMVIYGADNNWPYETLAEFEENSFIGGEYTLKTVQITDNVITDLGEIPIMEIDVMSAVYLDESSCYFANTDVVSQNGLIQVRAEYQFKETEETLSPQTLCFTIPDNCSYVSGSMKIDGEVADSVIETEGNVSVPLTELSGIITFNLKPIDFGTIQSRAILEFETDRGKFAADLGTIEVLAPYISLETGTRTTEEEIVVSGVTSPETEVKIYDGPYKIGTVRSSQSGRWSGTVTLVNARGGSVHDIKAVINEGTEEEKYSNTVNVLYDWSVEIIEFKATYLWEIFGQKIWCEVDFLNPKKKNVILNPAYPVIFTVRLSDNDKAEKVYIVNTKLGKEQLIEAEYSKSEDCWIAKEKFNKGLPGALFVRVIEKNTEVKINKDAEISIDPSSVSDALKNAEYEEIINEYDAETGAGELEGKIILADEESSEIGVKVTGKELEPDTVTEQKLLNEGYKKAESTEGSSVYYSKIETLENGDFKFKTVEVAYDPVNVVESMSETSIMFSLGELMEAAGTKGFSKEFGEELGKKLGQTFATGFGTASDSLGYMQDFLDEDGIYQRINQAYEVLTELYTSNQISKQVYSKKLDELIEINEKLMGYQLLKGAFFVLGGTAGLVCPPLGLGISLASSWIYELLDVDFDYMFADFHTLRLRWIVDPSGYVYEAVANNPLEGVTATIYYQEQDEAGNISAVCWDAEEYEQINPQITEADGVYAWDVPEGYWKVVFEKEGYETAETEWLPVPPIQTDINIGMVSEEAAVAEAATIYDEYVLLTFDKHVKADSITSETVIVISENETEYSFTAEPVNGSLQDETILATQFRLKFEEKLPAGLYAVMISKKVKDYADRNLAESGRFTGEVKSTVKEIKAELPKEIIMGEEFMIPVTIVTEGDPRDYQIGCISDAEYMAEITEVSEPDENGELYIKVDPKLPGEVTLDMIVDGAVTKQVSFNILIVSQGEIPDVPEIPEKDEVIRLSGTTRYETGYKVADALKEELGVEKFDAVVVATGKNFADALAGSYLAVQKNAPILLTNGKEDNIAALHEYIAANVAAGGKVYILGGEGAVPASVEAIDGYDVVRLAGKSRYETNLAILAEAGVTGDEIIVATGKTFADSLSASAAKLPILLVKPGAALSEEAKAIAENMSKFYIIGGEGAVSAEIEAELAAYGEVVRVSGKTRYETSVAVANTFFTDVEEAVVANGKNFPDGLCGGPLAAAMNAPLILTADSKTEAAVNYVQGGSIKSGFVLGGTGALGDVSVLEIFGSIT